jgi:hypothetical protein
VPSISGRVVNGLGFILDIRGDSVRIVRSWQLGATHLLEDKDAARQKECIRNATPVHDYSPSDRHVLAERADL